MWTSSDLEHRSPKNTWCHVFPLPVACISVKLEMYGTSYASLGFWPVALHANLKIQSWHGSLVFFPEVNWTSRLANPQYHISWDHELPHHILTKRTISLRKWKRMPVQLNYGSTIRRPKDSECWWKVTQDILRHRIRSNAQCFRGHRHKLSARHSVRMCPENKLAEDLHIKTGKNRLIAAIMDIYYHICGH